MDHDAYVPQRLEHYSPTNQFLLVYYRKRNLDRALSIAFYSNEEDIENHSVGDSSQSKKVESEHDGKNAGNFSCQLQSSYQSPTPSTESLARQWRQN